MSRPVREVHQQNMFGRKRRFRAHHCTLGPTTLLCFLWDTIQIAHSLLPMPDPATDALCPPTQTSASMSSSNSPFDIPEIASLIISYISDKADLARCARISHALHDICIPILWKSRHFSNLDVRMDLLQLGKLHLIEELTIRFDVTDSAMEMIAESCTGLKVLNFDGARVTAENLATLIPSDHYQARDIHLEDRSKRHKTRFPSLLESLTFHRCYDLVASSCLKIVSLLGPQLKRLSLNGFWDICEQDMIELLRRCPNLIGLKLRGTSITDKFLKNFAQELLPSDSTSSPGRRRRSLEDLNLDLSIQVSSEGVLSIVKACRSTLRTLSAQHVRSLSDEVLFALVDDPIDKDAIAGRSVEPNTLVMQHRFSPNTVLTELRLSGSAGLTDTGFQVLFQFATELASIELDSCRVGDGALMVLAQTYRNRMKALGWGVPAAWREHVLADERAQSLSPEAPAAEGHRIVNTVAFDPNNDSRESSETGSKVFTYRHLSGGLKRLLLHGSSYITNKGVRAILRSCVGLECLDIGVCCRLSLELFHGPWACSRLQDLDMSSMALDVREGHTYGDNGTAQRAQEREERLESLRFPLTVTPYPQEDDFDENGDYEHMAIPLDEYDEDGDEVRDNTPRRRAILREFYTKLGQLSQLRTLVMSYGKYRVRVKDGLELVLPGLQQNLTEWNVDMENGYQMGNSELEFFGKHFGYGLDFTVDEDDVGQDQLKNKTRKAKVESITLSSDDTSHFDDEVLKWAENQGFRLLMEPLW